MHFPETDLIQNYFRYQRADLRPVKKGNGWQFDWKYEFEQPDRFVYNLTIEGNPLVIQGLISFSDEKDHLFMHMIESAPFNKGKKQKGTDCVK